MNASRNNASISSTDRRTYELIQNYLLVWVDDKIDLKNKEYENILDELRGVIRKVNHFTTPAECIEFLDGLNDEKAFVISSGALGQHLMPDVHNMAQVRAIYIFCDNTTQYEEWTIEWPKIEGVFTEIKTMCQSLKQVVRECDHDTISMSFIPKQKMATTTTTFDQDNLDQLPPSFMYSTLFMEIILDIDENDNEAINNLIVYCREKNIRDQELKDFQTKYHQESPVWWYSCEIFLYSMLNHALCSLDMKTMTKLAFFIRSLHLQLQELHRKQTDIHNKQFIVYRGHGLSQEDFQHLTDSKDGLLSFNNFLSTSTERKVAMAFVNRSVKKNQTKVGVLYIMTIDPRKLPTSISTPFAFIDDYSAMVVKEKEVLFSMHTVFRVDDILQMTDNTGLWEVHLTLTDDNDPQLAGLTEYIKTELYGSTGWHRFGDLMIKVGDFSQAEELFNELLKKSSSDSDTADIYHQLGWVKYNQGYYNEAIGFYQQSLEISRCTLSEDDPSLSRTYNNIGVAYNNMGEYSNALEFYKKSHKTKEKVLPLNHTDLATSYSNIGFVYSNMGEYSKALEFYKKSLKIREKSLPPNHPDLATIYNNIGQVYKNMGEYSKALEYYKKSHKIYEKTLPPNHPNLAISYGNIGQVYNDMGEYSKALEYYEKSHKIFEETLPPNHSYLATSCNNLGQVYNNMGEYSKALEYYEKDIEIKKKTLSQDHPDLASSYNNIGGVYEDIGEYSKALEYHEKSYKIKEKVLSQNHPNLAISHLNFAAYYEKMGDYAKALRSLENAFTIQQEAFEENNQAFRFTYNRFGRVYRGMKEYSKALDYFQKCLVIDQKTLPEKHPYLGITYSNIGDVHRLMGDYAKALSFHQKALNIQENIQCDPLDCAVTYINLGETYYEMKDYITAAKYYQKGMEIYEKKLEKQQM